MKIKEAEQFVFPTDRWWKWSIFAPMYWSYVLTIWFVANLIQRFGNEDRRS